MSLTHILPDFTQIHDTNLTAFFSGILYDIQGGSLSKISDSNPGLIPLLTKLESESELRNFEREMKRRTPLP